MRFLTIPKFFGIRGSKFRKERLNFEKVKIFGRGDESLTLGDLGGGGGRVQSLLCLSSWESERERARECEHIEQCEKRRGVSLCVKAPTWPVCGNR